MNFDINTMILLSPWCEAASSQNRSILWKLSLRSIRLNFLVIIGIFEFVFIDFLWRAGNWILSTQKFVNQNSVDKRFHLIIWD